MSDAFARFMVEQLMLHGIAAKGLDSRGENLQAKCFRGHDHATPSLSIRKRDGAFICFGCGVRGPNWNVLARHLGAKQLREQDLEDQFELLKDGLTQYAQAEVRPELPWDVEPWEEPRYRGLSLAFMRRLSAVKWFDDGVKAYRLMLPIWQKGELMGWVARRLDKNKFMRYRNSPGLPAQDILYPYDFVVQYFRTKTIVLVEGPFDALRLLYHRVPALAIMGTNNYSDQNSSQLNTLGISKVVVCTDADEAGKKCRYEILDKKLSIGFNVKHYFPPAGKDPGNMPMRCIRELRDLTSASPKRNL